MSYTCQYCGKTLGRRYDRDRHEKRNCWKQKQQRKRNPDHRISTRNRGILQCLSPIVLEKVNPYDYNDLSQRFLYNLYNTILRD